MAESIVNTTLVQVEQLQEQNHELQMTIQELQQKQGQAQNAKKYQEEIKEANAVFAKLSDLMIQNQVPIKDQGTLKERLTNLHDALEKVVFEKYKSELGNGHKLIQVQKEFEELRIKYKDLEKSKVRDQENQKKKQELLEAQNKDREQQRALLRDLNNTIAQKSEEIKRLSAEVNKLRNSNKKLLEEQQNQAAEYKKQAEVKDIMIDILSCENLVAMEALGGGCRASDLVVPYLRRHHKTQQDAGFYEYCDKYFKRDIKRQCNVDIGSPKLNTIAPQSPKKARAENEIAQVQKVKDYTFRQKPKERLCVPLKPDPEVKKHVEQLRQRIKEKGSELPLEWRKIDVLGKKDSDSNLWGWFLDGKFINLAVQNGKLMCYKGVMKMDLLKYLSECQ